MSLIATVYRRAFGRRNEKMVVEYADDLKLFPSRPTRWGLLALGVLYIAVPLLWEDTPVFGLLSGRGVSLNTLAYAGVFAIATIGLNLLTGYTGQVSFGHSIFFGVGAYFTAYAGSGNFLGISSWPLWLWLPGAAVAGFCVGALVGPFALRLRGYYLVVVTLGLVFVGEHVFRNWNSVTGGNTGRSAAAVDLHLGPFDFRELEIGPWTFDEDQSLVWLIWFFVALVAWLVKNVVRSRPGRALQAVRDRDVAAEVIGIDLLRYKTVAFALSAAIAALAGALYAPLQLFIGPADFALLVSIQLIAMAIVGGLSTIYGSIVGAVVITALPRLIDGLSRDFGLPGVAARTSDSGIVTVSSLNVIIYGLLIAVFLLFEPRGLAGLWHRIRTYFNAWPFSY